MTVKITNISVSCLAYGMASFIEWVERLAVQSTSACVFGSQGVHVYDSSNHKFQY